MICIYFMHTLSTRTLRELFFIGRITWDQNVLFLRGSRVEFWTLRNILWIFYRNLLIKIITLPSTGNFDRLVNYDSLTKI